jgi:hypothetical protein
MLETMPRIVPIPAALRVATFTLDTARSFGITSSRLRGSDIAHPFHGVHSAHPINEDVVTRARAYLPRLASGHVFSHATAVGILEAPLPAAANTQPLDIAVAWPKTPPKTRGIRGHAIRTGLARSVTYQGLPIVAPDDAWCQLAGVLGFEDLVAVGDYLVSGNVWHGRTRRPFATLPELVASVQRHAGNRGIRSARLALPYIRSGVDARPESHLRLMLLAAGLPEPLIGDPTPVAGGLVLHPDLKLKRWRVLFEYEGELHFTDPRRAKLDVSRRELFEDANWRVIRVTSDDVYVQPRRFISRVREILASRETVGISE